MRLGQFGLGFSMIVASTICAIPARAQQASAASPREQLAHYVADLRKNPSDDALRERIIKLGLTLDPKPAVPDDAVIAAAKGKTIFTHAAKTGSKDDLKAAADAFAKASLLAPGVADYYFNQGAALEKVGQFDDAIRALNFYLMAAPNAADASEVRGRIEGIKYEKDSAAELSQQKAQAAQKSEQQFFLGLSGPWTRGGSSRFMLEVDVTSSSVKLASAAEFPEEYQGTISGREIEGTYTHTMDFHGQICGLGVVQLKGTFLGTISGDGQTISIEKSIPSQHGFVEVPSCRSLGEALKNETFQKQ